MADENEQNQTGHEDEPNAQPVTSDYENESLNSNQPAPVVPQDKKPGLFSRLKNINPYIGLMLILVATGIGVIIFLTVANDKNELSFTSTSLSEEDINNLASSQAEIASNVDLLKIAPNTVFDQSVIIKKNLEVVGDITVGGSVNIPGIGTTDGTQLEQANIAGDLAVQGNSSINGNLNIQNNLNVNGNMTVQGEFLVDTLSANNISFPGDLVLKRHIKTESGQTTSSTGTAVGGGGTTSVSGNDIAGTVNINTGSGTSSGSLISVSFRENYAKTPKVLITPVGANAASFNYYVTRNTAGFTISAASAPASSSNLQFDYFVIE